MPTLPSVTGAVTLVDFAKSLDPSGKVATVTELLNQFNEILTDMIVVEANNTTSHRSTIRTGLPSAVWRQLYQGVPPSKSLRAQVDDSIGMLETRAEIDKDVIQLNGNTEEFRLSESIAFFESLNQTMAETLFYGNAAINKERFTGLAPRYSSKSGNNATNIINAGGTGSDNTSVWLVVWGENTCHSIFPKGSQGGITHEDLGLIDAFDSSNNRFRAYADHWQWKMGLVLRDWRYVVRIANIDVSDLINQTGTQASGTSTYLLKLMLRAMARIPSMNMGRPVFYANRTVKEMISVLAMDKSQNAISITDATNQFGNVAPGSVGNGTLRFFGVPVRTCDQLLESETQVV